MAVAPRRVKFCSIFSYTCMATEKRERRGGGEGGGEGRAGGVNVPVCKICNYGAITIQLSSILGHI